MPRVLSRPGRFLLLLAGVAISYWLGYGAVSEYQFEREKDRLLRQVLMFKADHGRYPNAGSAEDARLIRFDKSRVWMWDCSQESLTVVRNRSLEYDWWTYDFRTGEWTKHTESI